MDRVGREMLKVSPQKTRTITELSDSKEGYQRRDKLDVGSEVYRRGVKLWAAPLEFCRPTARQPLRTCPVGSQLGCFTRVPGGFNSTLTRSVKLYLDQQWNGRFLSGYVWLYRGKDREVFKYDCCECVRYLSQERYRRPSFLESRSRRCHRFIHSKSLPHNPC
jgi:hypothetical protein